MNENPFKVKGKQLAIEIVNLYRYLTDEKKEYVISKQVLRSGTSVGANISESKGASSTKDFINKLCIALKECDETTYWLELLCDTGFIDKEYFNKLFDMSTQLSRMLTSSIKTMRERETIVESKIKSEE